MNENHMTWIDEKPYVTSPDFNVIGNSGTGDPITNTIAAKGTKAAVIGFKAPEVLRTPEAFSVLAPSFFGFSTLKRFD